MRPLLPKVRQDLGDTVTDRGWDGTDQGGRRPGSLWTPPQLPPGISSCLKPQRVFIRRPNRPEARLSALGSPTAVAWQEPKHSGLPAPGAGRPCSPEQWPLLVEGSVPPKDLLADPGQGSPVVHPRGLHVPRTCPSVLSRTTCRALGARATWRLETLGSHGGDMEGDAEYSSRKWTSLLPTQSWWEDPVFLHQARCWLYLLGVRWYGDLTYRGPAPARQPSGHCHQGRGLPDRKDVPPSAPGPRRQPWGVTGRAPPSWLSKCSLYTFALKKTNRGFPGGAVVENPPANAGDTGSSPGPGRSHMPRGN
ncbi:uncharacterized protein LOC103016450 isoform X5 [Balaenoptera acutorostrata]|uniref:Uncharacterized protein LOC103016450 isoform X5 n=1 Tax=Balaenoptera acutorostrata TaxID=9767 RepID=A0ABM3S7L2_BALAC|nr:uncharacterized protein LOC103016450 isoform X5 [Balaenoptera acutorostrata]